MQSIGDYQLNAELFEERDGSITLGLREIDLAVNAPSKEQAVRLLAADLLEYAQEYCQQIDLWHSAPNRKPHLPYVLCVLSIGNQDDVSKIIKCQSGITSDTI